MTNSNTFNTLYNDVINEGLKSSLAGAALGAATLFSPGMATSSQARSPAIEQQDTVSVYKQTRDDLIRHEGGIPIQKRYGHFRDGRFYPYKDSKNIPTIGYGHRILPTENFANGITPEAAEEMLSNDMQKAWRSAHKLMKRHGVDVNSTLRSVLTNMVFQMGERGVLKFENMWKGLAAGDYMKAADEMLDSKWHNSDSPNRAKELSRRVRALN